MEFDAHQRARSLVDEARLADISPEDAHWLRSHTAGCAECARYEEAIEGVVCGIRSFAFDADRAMVERMQEAVARHARGRLPMGRWALAAAAALAIATIPVYRGMRDAQIERADALLVDEVESRVGRAVPLALEPLLLSRPAESQ
jgi:hypothetical protein